MFCGDTLTICQRCGKQVHTAPGICVLCGEQLGPVHVAHASAPSPSDAVTLDAERPVERGARGNSSRSASGQGTLAQNHTFTTMSLSWQADHWEHWAGKAA